MARREETLAAIVEAARLHREYDSEARAKRGEGRVDVFGMLVARDIPLLFRPLKNLLGAYIDDPDQGVMVTTKLGLPVQRFTAAHELGHASLGHKASLDDQEVLERPIFAMGTSDDPREDQANAFAAELLTPEWLIDHHMERQGWHRDSFSDPAVVYQLALRMGSSYLATCYALAQCDAIDRATRDRLVKIKVKSIKESLTEPYVPTDWRRDVWLVTERDNGMVLEGSRSDLVILKLREHAGSGYVWQFGDLADTGLEIVNDGRTPAASDQHIGGVVFRTVIAKTGLANVEVGATGRVNLREMRPWQDKGKPLHSFDLDVNLSGPVTPGLHPSQREAALLEVA